MKLFLYDLKHNNVHAELNLGDINNETKYVINQIIEFLDEEGVIDGRYKCLTIARAINTAFDEDGEKQLVIIDEQL